MCIIAWGRTIVIVVKFYFVLFCSLFFYLRPAKKNRSAVFLVSLYSSDIKALIFTKESLVRSSLLFPDNLLQRTSIFLFTSLFVDFPSMILLHCLACKTWKLTFLVIYLSNFPYRWQYNRSVNTFVKLQYFILLSGKEGNI